MYYSAAFAQLMLKLMIWARKPASPARLRVITLSPLESAEAPLIGCMQSIPYWDAQLTLVRFRGDEVTEAEEVSLGEGGFAEQAFEKVWHGAAAGAQMIVMCHQAEFMAAAEHMVRNEITLVVAANESTHIRTILGSLGMEQAPGLLLWSQKSSRYSMELANNAFVVIGCSQDMPCWDSGRIVQREVPVSYREILEMGYNLQRADGTPPKIFTVATDARPEYPTRRLENDQIWGFLAGIAWLLRGENIDPRQIYWHFLTGHTAIFWSMWQFTTMGFHDPEPRDRVVTFPPCDAGHMLARLLPSCNFDFHEAWFLARGLTSQASPAVKRAISYITAAKQFGDGVVQIPSLCQLLSEARTRPASQLFGEYLAVPPQIYDQGYIWWVLGFLEMNMNSPLNVQERVRTFSMSFWLYFVHSDGFLR